jgi:hypothetical protein
MADQPEALRLADALEGRAERAWTRAEVAAELRRLFAENERLHQINQSHEMKLSVRGYEIQIADLKAENESLKRTLAASCDEERDQLWEASPGGGCSRALSAEAVNRELLEALKGVLALPAMQSTADGTMSFYSAVRAADAAIAKAEGEQR